MSVQAFVPRSLQAENPERAPAPRGRWEEAGALLLFAGAIFLALSLASLKYDPDDPSFAGGDWMGEVGALIGRILVQGFGLGAWLVVLELLFVGAPLLKGRRPEKVGLRLAGDIVLLVLVASLLQVTAPDAQVFGYARSGGNVGLFFGELMRGLFSAPGSFLVGFTGIGLLLIGRSSFSFIEWCERAILFEAKLRDVFLGLLARVSRAWREARQLRQAASETRRPPKIESVDPDQVIVHHLEDVTPWIPMEATGHPPVALSLSLRQVFDAREHDSQPPAPDEPCPEVHGASAFASAVGFADAEPAFPPSSDEYARDGVRTGRFSLSFDDESVGASLAGDLEGFFGGAADSAELGPESSLESPLEPPLGSAAGIDEAPIPEPRIVDRSPDAEVRVARSNRPRAKNADFELPRTDILEPAELHADPLDRAAILANADLLEKTLFDYGVTGKVEEIHPGPTVTTYEVAPAAGTKVSKVASLSDDLALGLSRKVRIIAPIPGKSRIGFELPNDERQPVNLRELVEDERFDKLADKAPLPVVLGRDIVGAPFYADLASMPHVIVAGATGAGKSVGLNVMLSSLLFRRTPEELRLLMIDPKVVELAPFDRIPHLLLPVVTDMKQAAQALKWAVDEMERRYQLFADAGTKNITTYNRYVQRVLCGELPAPREKQVEAVDANGDLTMMPASKNGSDGVRLPEKMPYIVIVVDEFADLMMQQGKEVEASVARLAQKARAAGMHVILATQRPSVDVITGMIKANFPSRIAFRVAQKVDSRTILDEQGAEVLLGKGDMLVKLNGATETRRVQCPFVSEEEVSLLTDHLRAQGEPQYQESILEAQDSEEDEPSKEQEDARFEEALLIVRETQRCSTSWLQRKMTIGYNRAAKIVEMMERRGYVGPPNGSRDREVMIPPGCP